MLYSESEILKAAEIGEISMIDAEHIVSLLSEAKQKLQNEAQKETFQCYEIHVVQSRMFGCNKQCSECSRKESQFK